MEPLRDVERDRLLLEPAGGDRARGRPGSITIFRIES